VGQRWDRLPQASGHVDTSVSDDGKALKVRRVEVDSGRWRTFTITVSDHPTDEVSNVDLPDDAAQALSDWLQQEPG